LVLVESFKSTLDEVREADILLHVADISHPQYEDQIAVVNQTLQELKAYDKPVITIFNKLDLFEKTQFDPWLEDEVKEQIRQELKERWENELLGNCIFVSATERHNIEALRNTILNKVKAQYHVRYPYKTAFFY
jgi:GTP-binding protein HflX